MLVVLLGLLVDRVIMHHRLEALRKWGFFFARMWKTLLTSAVQLALIPLNVSITLFEPS
jgi:hypothetical protein